MGVRKTEQKQQGYYRFPTIYRSRVVFVSDDDLWSVPVRGGRAERLTTSISSVAMPVFSPDGKWLAFRAAEEGPQEVYVMPAEGGEARRLTFLGGLIRVCGWTRKGRIVFASTAAEAHPGVARLYAISPEGGSPVPLPYGNVSMRAEGPRGVEVLGRYTSDPARWKRYRGGMRGVLWVRQGPESPWKKLLRTNGNATNPMILNGRVWFLSDHKGVGNLFSCDFEGNNLKQHTRSKDFYLRNAGTDGRKIVWQCAGDLFVFDPKTEKTQKVEITFPSPRAQRQRKFVTPARYREDWALHAEGHSLGIITRGQAFYFGNWQGAVNRLTSGKEHRRFRLIEWLRDGSHIVTVCDIHGEHVLEVWDCDTNQVTQTIRHQELGRIEHMLINPDRDFPVLAIENHRHELWLLDLRDEKPYFIERSPVYGFHGMEWSADGRWLAYAMSEDRASSRIILFSIASGKAFPVTDGRFFDQEPSFDPEGKYLYFLSYRDFRPLQDGLYFDLNFPYPVVPCLVTLQADTLSPFRDQPEPLAVDASKKAKDDEKKDGEKNVTAAMESAGDDGENRGPEPKSGEEQPVTAEQFTAESIPEPKPPEKAEDNVDDGLRIDFDGIERRVLAFPVSQKSYVDIRGIKGRVLLHSIPRRPGYRSRIGGRSFGDEGSLFVWNFKKQKLESVMEGVGDFVLLPDKETLAYEHGEHLRVLTVDQAMGNTKLDESGVRNEGWIVQSRIRLEVNPAREWRQMFREVWRLQHEDFWAEHMMNVDWQAVYERYAPLVGRVSTRHELSDLIWELQGELGASHAYEMGGEYRRRPHYAQGYLGADLELAEGGKGYRITRIYHGDSWEEDDAGPLSAPGINVREGDVLLAINRQELTDHRAPEELLVNQAGQDVELTIIPHDDDPGDPKNPRRVTIPALHDETGVRYRDWVEGNRRKVETLSEGRLGYLHVPDMMGAGYAEFHRYYAKEVERDGLIVDVRFNAGGNVSQLLLEKLARRRIAYVVSRYDKPSPYPHVSPAGPVVALANEVTGSDGDIFTQSFKLLGVGKVVGRRTWGGVIGIRAKHYLVDGTLATQPGYHYWFKETGWKVENHGATPDVNVEIDPGEWHEGKDRQLERAVRLALRELEDDPPDLPEFPECSQDHRD